MIKIFTNERCESNQFEVEEKMEYLLMKLFTSSESDKTRDELINQMRIKIESYSTCQYRQQLN